MAEKSVILPQPYFHAIGNFDKYPIAQKVNTRRTRGACSSLLHHRTLHPVEYVLVKAFHGLCHEAVGQGQV